MIFVDTSAWFAKFVPDDVDHPRIEALLNTTDEILVTTDFCIDETLTLLAARNELRRAIVAGRRFFNPQFTRIHFVTKQQFERAWILFQQRAAAGWSFTDCTSKIVIDERGDRHGCGD